MILSYGTNIWPKKKGRKKMNNGLKIKRLVGLASLLAIVVVLQLLSLVIRFGPFSITLALIPLVVGAILYGPKGGAVLGFTMGFVVLLTNAEAFWVINPLATIVLCLLKSTVAGIGAGFIYKSLKNKSDVAGTILASISAPIVNTGIFALGCVIFFFPTLKEWANGENAIAFLFLGLIGLNFIMEFLINSILSPIVYYIVNTIATKYNIGQENFKEE